MEAINVLCWLNSLTAMSAHVLICAFDIFNNPEIVNLQHIKGGVTHKVSGGRGGELGNLCWGSSGSNVQVRLYDKNERNHCSQAKKLDLACKSVLVETEFQLNPKAIRWDIQDMIYESTW